MVLPPRPTHFLPPRTSAQQPRSGAIVEAALLGEENDGARGSIVGSWYAVTDGGV